MGQRGTKRRRDDDQPEATAAPATRHHRRGTVRPRDQAQPPAVARPPPGVPRGGVVRTGPYQSPADVQMRGQRKRRAHMDGLKRAFKQQRQRQRRVHHHGKRARQQELPEPCTICMDPISPEETRQLGCGHRLHADCWHDWKARRAQVGRAPDCPVCRHVEEPAPELDDNQARRRRQLQLDQGADAYEVAPEVRRLMTVTNRLGQQPDRHRAARLVRAARQVDRTDPDVLDRAVDHRDNQQQVRRAAGHHLRSRGDVRAFGALAVRPTDQEMEWRAASNARQVEWQTIRQQLQQQRRAEAQQRERRNRRFEAAGEVASNVDRLNAGLADGAFDETDLEMIMTVAINRAHWPVFRELAERRVPGDWLELVAFHIVGRLSVDPPAADWLALLLQNGYKPTDGMWHCMRTNRPMDGYGPEVTGPYQACYAALERAGFAE